MKPNTYTQIYIHLVFAVKFRENLLRKKHREILFPYISGLLTMKKHKSIAVNGMEDHIHILLGLNPNQSITDLVRDIKRSSALFINQNQWFQKRFQWQEGFGGFSYAKSNLDNAYRYILRQEEHHKKVSFKREYLKMLEKFEISFQDEYLFEFLDTTKRIHNQ
ncbi:MAG: IS200/IS605 family transposase [Marinifilaceae bacterium]